MRTLSTSPRQDSQRSCLVVRCAVDCFSLRAGKWFAVIHSLPTVGELVLAVGRNRAAFIARYEGKALALWNGQKVPSQRCRIFGVVRTLDRFVRDSFPLAIDTHELQSLN